ncbi:2919_t:CDS:1, partial [Diversispora eburnea]
TSHRIQDIGSSSNCPKMRQIIWQNVGFDNTSDVITEFFEIQEKTQLIIE